MGKDDEIVGVIGSARDVTERREAEEELRISRKKFIRFFESSPDPVFILDEEGVFEHVNEAALQKLGFDRGEIVGSSLWNSPFLPKKTMEKTTENFERRKEGEEIPLYEVELRTKS